MIESWMVHGTDQWYIDPDEWDSIHPDYQSRILEDILKEHPSIAEEYRYTIFNRFKRRVFREAETVHLNSSARKDLELSLERERGKFSDKLAN
jgi:hypothetical protein